ncbi:MAG: 1,4-dihydroxy-2-naphthoate polyprenyltransferase [Desulfobacterales bacterium]|nr:MAG: 1,4-dihydroxy-2-naphthoate polyprenyltransferase [Desulfobacterales bacterium]
MPSSQSKISLWWLAARPKTLPAAAAPVIVGSSVAYFDKVFSLFPALAAFFGALLLQIAVNLANDYFDAKNQIDSEERLGPVRVTQSGLIPPAHVKLAMVLTLCLAALVFVYLTYTGGIVIFWVACASVLSALAYSGGPYPLASHGLGELFVFIFFGLVAVCGTYWVQAKTLSLPIVMAAIAPGLLISAIMVVNNLRDIKTDAPAGKKTLAVRLGRERTILLFKTMVIASYACVPLLAVYFLPFPIFLSFLTLPLAISVCREIKNNSGKDLNVTLAKTATLSLFFSLFFAIGIIVSVLTG